MMDGFYFKLGRKLYHVVPIAKSKGIFGILQTLLFKIFYHVQSRNSKYDIKNLLNFRWQEERTVDSMSAFLHHRCRLLPCKS
jgi:hypothetical protein